MKIYDSSADDLWTALNISSQKGPVLSVVGAGGKSSVIRHLSNVLNHRKVRHYIGTTAHMWPMDGGLYGKQIGTVDKDGKVGPPCEEVWSKIFSEGCPVLIEADGSKGLPCKVPEAWEPVLRKETTHVLGVIGVSCLDKEISKICHRPECVAKLLNCRQEDRLKPEHLVEIIKSKDGLYKNVDTSWKYHVILNQVDDEEIYHKIMKMKESLKSETIDGIWFTHMLHEIENTDNGDVV